MRSSAVRHADSTRVEPAVWFSIAGTRPVACNARKATPAPIEFGSIIPTVSPRAVPRAKPPAEHKARREHAVVAERAGGRVRR